MKNSIKLLIKLNLLSYFSYLVYSIVYSQIEIKNWWVIVAIMPYILVIISAFSIAFNDDKTKSKGIKGIALIDLIIRISVMFINFYTTILNKTSLRFKIFIVSMIILFIINVLLEIWMYKKACSIKELDEIKLRWIDVPFEDRANYENISKSFQKCFGEQAILIVIISIILGFNRNSRIDSIIVLSFIDFLLIYFYFKRSYISLQLFYRNKIEFKKTFIRENIYVVSSILVGIIFAIGRILGYGNDDAIKFLGLVLQCIILYPKFKNGTKRARKFLKLKNIKYND